MLACYVVVYVWRVAQKAKMAVREEGMPSGGMVDAVGLFRHDRVGMTNPFSWVSEIYKQNAEGTAYAKYRFPWQHARHDPASLLFGKDRHSKKKRTHFGYTPPETGSYIFVISIEGTGKQVLGAGWFGPQATVLFKGLSTHMGYTAELKYTLPQSNNRLWLRSLNSLLECNRIEIHVKLDSLLPVYFFPCYSTTPIPEMFNTGAFTAFSVRPHVAAIAEPEEADKEKKTDEPLAALFYKARGDMELQLSDNTTRLKVHRTVLYAKSEWINARAHFNDDNDDATTVVAVDGKVECWELIISAMYEMPVATDSVKLLLLALELADYYVFSSDVKRALTAKLEFTPKSVFPIMVHAWHTRDIKLFQDGLMCLGENEGILADTRSALYEEAWAAVYNGFRRTNPELDRALKRAAAGIDWDVEVSGMWTMTMSALFDTAKRARSMSASS